MLFWIPVAALIVAALGGVAAGLSRPRFRRAPVIANVVMVATYASAVAAVGAWASRCWNCSVVGGYGEDSRALVYFLMVAYLGLLAVVGVALTWLAAVVSILVWRGQSPLDVRAVVLGWAVLIFAVVVLVFASDPFD